MISASNSRHCDGLAVPANSGVAVTWSSATSIMVLAALVEQMADRASFTSRATGTKSAPRAAPRTSAGEFGRHVTRVAGGQAAGPPRCGRPAPPGVSDASRRRCPPVRRRRVIFERNRSRARGVVVRGVEVDRLCGSAAPVMPTAANLRRLPSDGSLASGSISSLVSISAWRVAAGRTC